MGTTVTVTGNGFKASASGLSLVFGGTDYTMSGTTSASGVLTSASFTVPAVNTGSYTVAVSDGTNTSPNFATNYTVTASTVSFSSAGTYTITVPAGVTSFGFTMNGAGGGGGDSGAAGGAGGTVTGTITFPSSRHPNFILTVRVSAAAAAALRPRPAVQAAPAVRTAQQAALAAPAVRVLAVAAAAARPASMSRVRLLERSCSSAVAVAVPAPVVAVAVAVVAVARPAPPQAILLELVQMVLVPVPSAAAVVVVVARRRCDGDRRPLLHGHQHRWGRWWRQCPWCRWRHGHVGQYWWGRWRERYQWWRWRRRGRYASGGGGAATGAFTGGGGGGGSAYPAVQATYTVSVSSASNGGGGAGGSAGASGTAGSVSFTGAGISGSGTATKLVFTTQPVATSAEATNFSTSPVVWVEDASGNLVTSDTSSVTLAINSGPAAGSLACSNSGFPTISAVAGVATFTNCQITGTATAGTYTLKATRTGLTTATSGNVVINVGTASQLVFTTAPVGNVAEATNFSTSPVVWVESASGNLVTSDTSSVTLAINSGPAAGSLACSNSGFPTISAVAGVATFTNCQITGTATAGTYTLKATRTGLTTATSGNVVINVGTASQLVFTTAPVGNVLREATNFTTSPAVSVEDASGNLVTSDTSSVTLAINSGPAAGSLSCSNSGFRRLGSGWGGDVHQLPDNRDGHGRDLHAQGHPHGAHHRHVGQRRHQRRHGLPARVHHRAGGQRGRGDELHDLASGVGGGRQRQPRHLRHQQRHPGDQLGSGRRVAVVLQQRVPDHLGSGWVATFTNCQITGTAAAGTYTLGKATRTGLTTATSGNVVINVGTASKLVFTPATPTRHHGQLDPERGRLR